MKEELHDLKLALEAFLAQRYDETVRVERLRPLAGGASRKLYAFELCRSDAAPCGLVLRMDPEPGRLQSDRSEEFALLAVARDAGVTVPAVHWLGDADAGLGARFILMEQVAGDAIARHLLRDEAYSRTREALPEQLARELARIHRIAIDDERLAALRERAPTGDARRFARSEVERYRALCEIAADGHPQPVLALVARWLEHNAPELDEPALVHGDFRIGNILFDERGLTAVLDWELAHIGDPLEDVAWLCVRAWRFGVDDQPVGGLCAREHFWELYERYGGRRINSHDARYWEIFGNWKWAIICMVQAASHRTGRYPNVELASLGRRVPEVEWELLQLLEATG